MLSRGNHLSSKVTLSMASSPYQVWEPNYLQEQARFSEWPLVFILLCFLRQGLTAYPRLPLNLPVCCHCLLGAVITGVCHHARGRGKSSRVVVLNL